MDFLEDKPDLELYAKVRDIATLILGLADMFNEISKITTNQVMGMVFSMTSATLKDHLQSLYKSNAKLETLTTSDCYDILFRASETSIPVMVELDRLVEVCGATIAWGEGNESEEPASFAQALREIIAR